MEELEARREAQNGQKPEQEEEKADQARQDPHPRRRPAFQGRGGKETVREVETRRGDARDVEDRDPRDPGPGPGQMGDEDGVERVGLEAEEEPLRTELPEMAEDEGQHDHRRHALHRVDLRRPVARDVGLRPRPPEQDEAVTRVIRERQEDEDDLEDGEELPALDPADDTIPVGRAAEHRRVGEEMLDEEREKDDGAGDRVQPSASLHGRRVYDESVRARPIAAILALCTVLACSRAAKKPPPVASLPGSPAAAIEFMPIRESWETRRVQKEQVEGYLARWPKDATAPIAKLYLVFLAFDQGQVANGDALLASVGSLPSGTTNDLATIARARSLRLHGAPQSALDSLRSLVGKVVDDGDREVFLEEIALSSIAAHDDYEAVAYLDAWLRGVGEDDKERVRAKIDAVIVTLPRKVLEDAYREMRRRGASSGYGSDMQKVVAERLAHIAVQTNDAALARWLVDESGVSAAQTGGDAGVELGELASSRRGIATFAGRSVGLLVPTRDRELRDEAADVVRGISWALDLPRKTSTPDDVRLVTRDDGIDDASTNFALEELAGEGVGIVIGGFDRASADRAVAWSERTGIPVLLLNAPRPELMPKTSAVVLGEPTDREMEMLGEALVKSGAKTVAFVAAGPDEERSGAAAKDVTLLPPVRCDIPLAEAGHTRFPIAAWEKAGARGWMLAGSAQCSKDVLRDIESSQKSGSVALTLESGVQLGDAPRKVTVFSASAGIIPVLDVKTDETKRFVESFGVRPSWWTALGHDAGILSKAALARLPLDTTNEASAIAQRRALVLAGLASAKAQLWTTDETSIGNTRILDRNLRLVTWPAARRDGKP